MKTNDQIYQELLSEARDLIGTHQFNSSKERAHRLRLLIYLMDAYLEGQDITLARLAYDDDLHRAGDPIGRLRQHLGQLPLSYEQVIYAGCGFYVLDHRAEPETQPLDFLMGDALELGR